jgi:hypothetical protein
MTEDLIVETLDLMLNLASEVVHKILMSSLFGVFHRERVAQDTSCGNSLRPDFVKNEAREEVDLNEAQPRGYKKKGIRTCARKYIYTNK